MYFVLIPEPGVDPSDPLRPCAHSLETLGTILEQFPRRDFYLIITGQWQNLDTLSNAEILAAHIAQTAPEISNCVRLVCGASRKAPLTPQDLRRQLEADDPGHMKRRNILWLPKEKIEDPICRGLSAPYVVQVLPENNLGACTCMTTFTEDPDSFRSHYSRCTNSQGRFPVERRLRRIHEDLDRLPLLRNVWLHPARTK